MTSVNTGKQEESDLVMKNMVEKTISNTYLKASTRSTNSSDIPCERHDPEDQARFRQDHLPRAEGFGEKNAGKA